MVLKEKEGLEEYYTKNMSDRFKYISRDIVNYTQELLKGVGKKHVVIFIGRGSTPFYVAARKLSPALGLDRSNTTLVQGGEFLRHLKARHREGLKAFVRKLDLKSKNKAIVVDTGIKGTEVNSLSDVIKSVYPHLNVVGRLVYSNNPNIKGIKQADIYGPVDRLENFPQVPLILGYTKKGKPIYSKYNRYGGIRMDLPLSHEFGFSEVDEFLKNRFKADSKLFAGFLDKAVKEKIKEIK